MSVKKFFYRALVLFPLVGLVAGGLTSCSEKDDTWDPYYNWPARNTLWFQHVADTARTAIAQARAAYGDAWEDHCQWRMYKSLQRSADVQGPLSDSICVRILQRGSGTFSPAYTDRVRLNFRGWTMPTEYVNERGEREQRQAVFTQTYYGEYDPLTATPQLMQVNNTIEGYGTALQYMVAGDDWLVYIPAALAYQDQSQNAIPAYSTLLFRLSVVSVYEAGQTVPDWK